MNDTKFLKSIETNFGSDSEEYIFILKKYNELGIKVDLFGVKPKKDTIDFQKLLDYLNSKTSKKMRVVNQKVKNKYKSRLREGYKKEDIVNAINNAVKVPYHIENNFTNLTIEFFSRSEIIDKYGFISTTTKKMQSTTDKIKVG